jgi:hypothetical protein
MTFLLTLHSLVRWFVVALLIITLVRLLAVWLGNREYSRLDGTLMKVFSGFFDLQVLIGIILLIVWASTNGMIRQIYEHVTMMALAAVAVHITAKWKKSPGQVRARNTAIMLLIAAVLIVVGVMRLPQGWTPTSMGF